MHYKQMYMSNRSIHVHFKLGQISKDHISFLFFFCSTDAHDRFLKMFLIFFRDSEMFLIFSRGWLLSKWSLSKQRHLSSTNWIIPLSVWKRFHGSKMWDRWVTFKHTFRARGCGNEPAIEWLFTPFPRVRRQPLPVWSPMLSKMLLT